MADTPNAETLDEKTRAFEIFRSMTDQEKQEASAKILRRKFLAIEFLLAIARMEGIEIQLGSRRSLPIERIAVDDDGDVVSVPAGAWAAWTSQTTLLEVVGPGYGTAHDQLGYLARQPLYEEAWESFKMAMANR